MYTSSIFILAASASLAIARPQEAVSTSSTLLPGAAALVQAVHSDGSPYVSVRTATSFTGTVYTTALVTKTRTVDCGEGTVIFNGTTAYPTSASTNMPDLPSSIVTSDVSAPTSNSVSSIPPPTFPGMHGPPANGSYTYSYNPTSIPYPSAPTGGAAAQPSNTKTSQSNAAEATATSGSSSSSDNGNFGQGATSAASTSFAATEGTLVSLVALVVAGLVL